MTLVVSSAPVAGYRLGSGSRDDGDNNNNNSNDAEGRPGSRYYEEYHDMSVGMNDDDDEDTTTEEYVDEDDDRDDALLLLGRNDGVRPAATMPSMTTGNRGEEVLLPMGARNDDDERVEDYHAEPVAPADGVGGNPRGASLPVPSYPAPWASPVSPSSLFFISLGSDEQRVAREMPAFFCSNPHEEHMALAYSFWKDERIPARQRGIAKRWLRQLFVEIEEALAPFDWGRYPNARVVLGSRLGFTIPPPPPTGPPPAVPRPPVMSSHWGRDLSDTTIWRIM